MLLMVSVPCISTLSGVLVPCPFNWPGVSVHYSSKLSKGFNTLLIYLTRGFSTLLFKIVEGFSTLLIHCTKGLSTLLFKIIEGLNTLLVHRTKAFSTLIFKTIEGFNTLFPVILLTLYRVLTCTQDHFTYLHSAKEDRQGCVVFFLNIVTFNHCLSHYLSEKWNIIFT